MGKNDWISGSADESTAMQKLPPSRICKLSEREEAHRREKKLINQAINQPFGREEAPTPPSLSGRDQDSMALAHRFQEIEECLGEMRQEAREAREQQDLRMKHIQ